MPLILQRSLVNDSLLNDKWKLKRKTGIIFHTYLYNGSEIWAKFRNSREGGEDIHKRLMNKYKDVPDWYACFISRALFI